MGKQNDCYVFDDNKDSCGGRFVHMIINQRHLGICVTDLDKGIEFYSALGGILTSQDLEQGKFIEELLNESGVILKSCKIKFQDGSRIELMEFTSSRHIKGQRNPNKSISQFGYHHVAFTVKDIATTQSIVMQFGGESLGEIVSTSSDHSIHAVNAKHVYMRDPFGNLLHIAEDIL